MLHIVYVLVSMRPLKKGHDWPLYVMLYPNSTLIWGRHGRSGDLGDPGQWKKTADCGRFE